MNVEAEAAALAAKYPNKKPGYACGVERSGHRPLIEALISRGLKTGRVSEAIQIEKGVTVSYQTILRHQNRVCSCGK